MGWGMAKSNLRELFGARSNCTVSVSTGGRLKVRNVILYIALLVVIAASSL